VKEFKNPACTVDVIVRHHQVSDILLIKRKNAPFKDKWALPGGFIEYGKENLEHAALRELKEETDLKLKNKKYRNYLSLVGIYSEPDRDPRGHTISTVYSISGRFFKYNGLRAKAKDDAAELKWMNLSTMPKLAFDHTKVVFDYLYKMCDWLYLKENKVFKEYL